MPVAATNTAANQALFYLNRNSENQSDSLAKISSGSRIVSSSDDAAGLAISEQLGADISALEQASSTTQQIESVLQIADGGLSRIADILQRMKSLAVQYNSGTLDATSQGYINDEYDELATEIDLITTTTQYNGTNLLDGSYNETVIVGVDAADTMDIDLSGVDADVAGLSLPAVGTGITGTGDMTTIDTAIETVAGFRAEVGALTSSVEFQSENIETQLTNLEAANSSIVDADLAEEQTDFTNYQVLTEAAIAGLAQANAMKSSLLSLLK